MACLRLSPVSLSASQSAIAILGYERRPTRIIGADRLMFGTRRTDYLRSKRRRAKGARLARSASNASRKPSAATWFSARL